MIYIDDDLGRRPMGELLSALPPWRREAALRHRAEGAQRQSACAYLLLCRVLRQRYGIADPPRFAYGEQGKPYLPDYPGVHFNLSHCRTAVACAVDDDPVGIDIEKPRRVSPSLVSYVMSAEEVELIGKSPRTSEAFTKVWTRKEALAKLRGESVLHNMRHMLETPDARIVTLRYGEHIVSVATRSDRDITICQ